ncbi:family 43 glycosylhydrolase [Niabella yanshanensis]|uniref:Family 43 glycosylhydrolase n=1 Tax=Niabella yanshanensis TaxID=577386 RepID=A0ABZ0W985_9BACT|nr:family 43 glycosylhydrolase [Niabella yanshanensis]WQD39691.1 family 43 glycosylhydrolase [Niabella yanshanensis]
MKKIIVVALLGLIAISAPGKCFAVKPITIFQQNLSKRYYQDTGRIKPVIPGDFADPSVIRVGNTYYATGTSSEWAPHYPLFKSEDLIHWKEAGYIFDKTPEWASSSFWAPELFYRNGTYYVYYTARKKADGISCIGVATSEDPEKGFTDRGIVVEHGKEAIDAFITEEKDRWYLSFKAYGLDDRPIELLGYELSPDGLSTIGQPFMLLRDDKRKGLEGQCIIKRNDYYYLLYSAGGCCGVQCSYHVNVARSASLKGPYTSYQNNPVMDGFDNWKCTGHGTIVSDQKGDDYYMFHAYNKKSDVFTGREGMLSRVHWNKDTGWPDFEWISGQEVKGFTDDFNTERLSAAWQWDFRHARLDIKVKKGQLHLSGIAVAGNTSGTALTLRPAQYNYELSTTVLNYNRSSKGLVLYGDADQAIGIAAQGNQVVVWSTNDKTMVVHQTAVLRQQLPVHLKMIVAGKKTIQFFYSIDKQKWQEIEVGDFDNNLTPPWDRSARPGLLQRGQEPAIFEDFNIRYFQE